MNHDQIFPLRILFAANALQGILSYEGTEVPYHVAAGEAVGYADALIAALFRTPFSGAEGAEDTPNDEMAEDTNNDEEPRW